MMRRMYLLALCVLLIFGCARLKTAQTTDVEDNFQEIYLIGIGAELKDNNLIVTKLVKNGPAENAGIKLGDVIISVDGRKVNDKDLFDILNNKHHGEHISVVTRRNGIMTSYDIEPVVFKILPMQKVLDNLVIEKKKKVSIAIIVSQVKNSYPNVSSDWADSVRSNLQSGYESALISKYSEFENFSIVDRSKTNLILDEFKISQTGLVSDKLTAKIGEMTGATYLMDIYFSRFQGRNYDSPDDVTAVRLIDIQSGKVLAVDKMTEHR